MNGQFVISLDFELHWGVFDALQLDNYRQNLENVPLVIDRLLALSEKYNIKLTFATVGFLFAETKEELMRFSPEIRPSYLDKNLDPYRLIDTIGTNEQQDPLHFSKSIIAKIKDSKIHEIGTHTFSHYNCFGEGQTLEEFEADLIAAVKIGKNMDIPLESIVFPKNQVIQNYLAVCERHGIRSYRGTERSALYNSDVSSSRLNYRTLRRGLRMLDAYINITGPNTYPVETLRALKGETIVNLPSSRFLRPYIAKLSFLEPLKLRRIKKAMAYAAKNKELFHLWWHPHNFGANMDQNFESLETIFKEYAYLKEKYNFKSSTMTGLTKAIDPISQRTTKPTI